MSSLLTLDQLTYQTKGAATILRLSLTLAAGECFVLLSPPQNGSSVLLQLIAGMRHPDQGRILLRRSDITPLPPAHRNVQLLRPHDALTWYRSVAGTIMAGHSSRADTPMTCQQRHALLELMGLIGLETQRIFRLSPEQRLRVLLARALAAQPDVLLLDDPFAHLAAQSRAEIQTVFRQMQRTLGITTIFATHDRDEAFTLADRVGVLHHGRLLEVGSAEELYQRPQTEFVATFLGTANLLVGQYTGRGIQAGPLHFSIQTTARDSNCIRRVQVLFRPEDVALAPVREALVGTPLGQAEVVGYTFAGSFERLQLRLPPIPGVRPIAPPIPFGEACVMIEALRSLDQARHFPLRLGDDVWVGVRRMHALPHPGMHFLLLSDGSPAAHTALTVGGRMARLAQARITLLGYGSNRDRLQRHLREASEQMGSAPIPITTRIATDPLAEAVVRESQHQPCDLIVLGTAPQADLDVVERLLQVGDHHLLLIRQMQAPPTRILVCVKGGEPGKETIRFAGRLVRHLAASATLLAVTPAADMTSQVQEHTTRFLAAGTHTLAVLGVPAQTLIRIGDVGEQIRAELQTGHYDMLVVGAPLRGQRGLGIAGTIVQDVTTCPILIVRSPAAIAHPEQKKNGLVASLVDELMS